MPPLPALPPPYLQPRLPPLSPLTPAPRSCSPLPARSPPRAPVAHAPAGAGGKGGGDVWQVQELLRRRGGQSCCAQQGKGAEYLVRWEGEWGDSWQPEQNLPALLVAGFESDRRIAQAGKQAGRGYAWAVVGAQCEVQFGQGSKAQWHRAKIIDVDDAGMLVEYTGGDDSGACGPVTHAVARRGRVWRQA